VRRSRPGGGAIRPGADADTVAGAVGEDPGDWGVGIVDDAPAGCQSCGQALLGLFAGDGYVDVHRVTQGLGRVEALHPDRRSVAKGVNGVAVGQLGVPEDRPPEQPVELGILSLSDLQTSLDTGQPVTVARRRRIAARHRRWGQPV
jgi:hypothetical protein